MILRGKTISVLQFDGVLGPDCYAYVKDLRSDWEGPIRHFKARAWVDGILHVLLG